MISASIEIEFLAGANITEAVEDAAKFADSLGIAYVKFDFNGVSCRISARAAVFTSDQVFERYQKALRGDKFLII
jgi:hypothetical protein